MNNNRMLVAVGMMDDSGIIGTDETENGWMQWMVSGIGVRRRTSAEPTDTEQRLVMEKYSAACDRHQRAISP